MPAARITFAHFSLSSTTSFPKSAGEPGSTVPPRSASRAFTLGSASAALISLLSLSTISAGVAFGAQTPNQAHAGPSAVEAGSWKLLSLPNCAAPPRPRLDSLRGLSRVGSRWQEGRSLPAGREAPAMELMSGDARWYATSMLFVTGDTRPPVFSLVLSGIAKGPGRRLRLPNRAPGRERRPRRVSGSMPDGPPSAPFVSTPNPPPLPASLPGALGSCS